MGSDRARNSCQTRDFHSRPKKGPRSGASAGQGRVTRRDAKEAGRNLFASPSLPVSSSGARASDSLVPVTGREPEQGSTEGRRGSRKEVGPGAAGGTKQVNNSADGAGLPRQPPSVSGSLLRFSHWATAGGEAFSRPGSADRLAKRTA